MLLYIIRHGDPNYKKDCLTERGKLQAEAVGKRMLDAGINRVFTSPYGRAKETAEPTCRLLGIPYTVEEWAHEIEDERLTHFTFPDRPRSISMLRPNRIRENGGLYLSYEEAYTSRALSDTGMKQASTYIAEHGREFLERLGYQEEEDGVYRILKPNEDRVALFCHSCMARAWISYLLHIPLHLMWANYCYSHTGVTVLYFKNYEDGKTAPRCLSYSDISHLYAAGLDMIYDNDVRI